MNLDGAAPRALTVTGGHEGLTARVLTRCAGTIMNAREPQPGQVQEWLLSLRDGGPLALVGVMTGLGVGRGPSFLLCHPGWPVKPLHLILPASHGRVGAQRCSWGLCPRIQGLAPVPHPRLPGWFLLSPAVKMGWCAQSGAGWKEGQGQVGHVPRVSFLHHFPARLAHRLHRIITELQRQIPTVSGRRTVSR